MTSLIGFGRRTWTANYPPTPAKAPDAIRIGLFGASWIAYGAPFPHPISLTSLNMR